MTYASIHFQLCFIELDHVKKKKEKKKQESKKQAKLPNRNLAYEYRLQDRDSDFLKGRNFPFFFSSPFCIYTALYLFVYLPCGSCLFYSALLFFFTLLSFTASPLLSYLFTITLGQGLQLSIVHYAIWPIRLVYYACWIESFYFGYGCYCRSGDLDGRLSEDVIIMAEWRL